MQQLEPALHDLGGGRAAVGEGDGGEAHALVLDVLRVVGGVGGADEVRHAVVAQDPDVVLDGGVLRLLRDEEPHVLELDLGRRRTDDLAAARHVADLAAGWGAGRRWSGRRRSRRRRLH